MFYNPYVLHILVGRGVHSFKCSSSVQGGGATRQLIQRCDSLLAPLLQIFQDASVTEVVDVPAEVHQVGVDVCGHTAVGGGHEVRAEGHHASPTRWSAFGTPLYQGTKSVEEIKR